MSTTLNAYILRADGWKATGRTAITALGAYGTYKPTTANVALGLSTTSVVSTAQTYTTSGATYNDVRFDNWVTVNAPNVTFNRCLFRGPLSGDTTLNKRIVACVGSSVSNVVFNDCKWEPYDHTINGYSCGLGGHDFKVYRGWFLGAYDSMDIYSFDGGVANAEVYGCLMEKMDGFYPDPGHTDGTHNDNIQISNGSHIIILGNTMTGMLGNASGSTTPYYPQANSAIQFNQNGGATTADRAVSDVLIDRNWLDGGAIATINLATNPLNLPMVDIRITNNKFGRSGRVAATPPNGSHAMQNWAIVTDSSSGTPSQPTWVFTGNVYEDDGTAVVMH